MLTIGDEANASGSAQTEKRGATGKPFLTCAFIASGETIATLAFTEATIYDAEGKPCSHSTGTFKYVKRLPTGPKGSNALNVISTD